LNNTQKEAIRVSVNRFAEDTGPGIDKDFEESIPTLYHESRSEKAQRADESQAAPNTSDWQKWVSSPDQFDFTGVDTKK